MREAARNTQRIQKALEDANIKLTGVVSDILGKSGRAILDALVAGETDPEKLVELTKGRLKAPRQTLVEALRGHVRDHHRFVIKLHLAQVDALNQAVRDLEARVEQHVDPFRKNAEILTTIPGVSDTAASVIVSEIGYDMTRFKTAAHLVSWAGMCPRSDESAGKRRSSRIRHGAPWLKTTLVQCAWAAIRTKDSYLRAQFHRLKPRVGPMKGKPFTKDVRREIALAAAWWQAGAEVGGGGSVRESASGGGHGQCVGVSDVELWVLREHSVRQ